MEYKQVFNVGDKVRVKETGERGEVIIVREVSARPFVVGFGDEADDTWYPYAEHELEPVPDAAQ